MFLWKIYGCTTHAWARVRKKQTGIKMNGRKSQMQFSSQQCIITRALYNVNECLIMRSCSTTFKLLVSFATISQSSCGNVRFVSGGF